METPHLLIELLIVFAIAGGVVFLFQQLRVPSIVGLMVAGVMVGPHGLKLVSEAESVHLLAEIGVVVLLFTVGLEFSLSRLWRMWRTMLTIGSAQVLICGGVAFAATVFYLPQPGQAVFVGMLVAMSSTAVVLKLLGDRNELSTPHGRIAVAVLLLQDLLVLVFMVLLPALAARETAGQDEQPIWLAFLRGWAVIAAIVVAARYVVPVMLYWVVKTRNRELFLLAIVVVCLGTAAVTAGNGLSLALGAFLAGLALADSEYAHQTLAEVLPFRDTLSSLFFVSVGMLLNVGFVADHLSLVLVTVLAIVSLKFFAVALPVWLAGYSQRVALLAGLSLLQVGEFSFVLASQGIQRYELLSNNDYQTFLAAAVITMGLTPLSIGLGERLAQRASSATSSDRRGGGRDESDEQMPSLTDHVIIAGHGINGRNLARVLREVEIPYVIRGMNPVTVSEPRKQGEPIYFGDCSRESVLEHAGVQSAKTLVIAISDPASSRRAVATARKLNHRLTIIARTRYLAEVPDLRKLGADEIIPEEFETSVEIFARVLRNYNIPWNLVQDLVARIRRDHYGVLREETHSPARLELPYESFSEIDVEPCSIREGSTVVGKSLRALNLRAATGATLIAVRRGPKLINSPGPEFQFAGGDCAFLVGDAAQISRAIDILDPQIADTITQTVQLPKPAGEDTLPRSS